MELEGRMKYGLVRTPEGNKRAYRDLYAVNGIIATEMGAFIYIDGKWRWGIDANFILELYDTEAELAKAWKRPNGIIV
jgi:hypothetical protein